MSQLKLLFLLFLQAKTIQVPSSFLPSPRHVLTSNHAKHAHIPSASCVSAQLTHVPPSLLSPVRLPLPPSPSVRAFGPPPVCSSALPRLAALGLSCRPCVSAACGAHTRLLPPARESLSGALSFIRLPPNHPTSIPRPAHAPRRLLSPKPAARAPRVTMPHMRTFTQPRVSRHSSRTCLLPFSHPSAFTCRRHLLGASPSSVPSPLPLGMMDTASGSAHMCRLLAARRCALAVHGCL